MKITIIVEKTNTGFCAHAQRYAAYTTGDTLEDTRANMVESLNLFFSEKSDRKVTEQDLIFVLDYEIEDE